MLAAALGLGKGLAQNLKLIQAGSTQFVQIQHQVFDAHIGCRGIDAVEQILQKYLLLQGNAYQLIKLLGKGPHDRSLLNDIPLRIDHQRTALGDDDGRCVEKAEEHEGQHGQKHEIGQHSDAGTEKAPEEAEGQEKQGKKTFHLVCALYAEQER